MSATRDMLVRTEGLTHVLQMLAARAREITGADYSALSTIDESGRLERFIYSGIDEDLARKMGPPPSGRGLLGSLVACDQPIRAADVSKHPEFTGFPTGHPGIGPFLGVPIRAADSVIGCIYVARDPRHEPFTEDEEMSTVFLALQAATAVSLAIAQERGSRLALLEERASIAHDLHDGTIQGLYALGLELDSHVRRKSTPPDTRDMLTAGIQRINDLIADIRQYIIMLEASASSQVPDLSHDLPFAIRQLVPPGIDTVLNVSAAALLETSGRVAEDLLYIAREAISNAVRHADATRIAVDLRQSDQETALTVQDNGTGFETETARVGLGTVSMRTRAERLGARLSLVSIPAMGTMVRVSIPRTDDERED